MKKKAIKKVIKNFDFERVNYVMYVLNWKWATYNAIPNVIQLKETAERLLQKVSKSKEYTEVSTGGFTAYKNDIEIGLRFTIENFYEFYKQEN